MYHYNLNWLLQKIMEDEKVDYLLFWGHANHNNEEVGKFIFSQWYPSLFTVDNIVYNTAEHWMMAQKARLFRDADTLHQILEVDTPKAAKILGREVKNFVPEVWDEHCFQIVVEGNRHKFSQHPAFEKYLLSTESKVIVEASPADTIWGIGLSQESRYAKEPDNWRGKNLLGFALMEVRDILRVKGN